MKLYTSLTSPFGRKCRMVAHVAGIANRVEVTEIDYKAEAYRKLNPLGKVPALARDDDTVLIDSPLISAYLASLGDEAAVYPENPEARWQALCLEALADGITDAGILIFMENKRREEHRSQGWIDAQASKINHGLDAIDAVAGEFGDSTQIGILAVAAAVGWLEFRSVVPDIRTNRPHLSAWLDRVATEDFMTATAPPPDA
ncbi:glutathione S-transferase N-terminal domain-containing protein [Magnetovibrio sp.]|uniref:glutathione S-transferase N-terminal domain-containing protein n=1 Tax=Magnetovibrio sp. TaxID=2024836 RepID=UPI002F95A29A